MICFFSMATDELDTEEQQLLRDIAALEEVENCSSLVLQELLQRKPSTPSSPACPQLQALHLQQVGHHQPHQITRSSHHPRQLTPSPHRTIAHHPSHSHHHQKAQHTQMHDARHFRNQFRQHPVRHVEVHLPLQSYHQQPADESPASLLHQVLECSTPSFATGLMRSGASLDCLVMNGEGMTLPALCSEPVSSKKTPVSTLRKTKTSFRRRAIEKSSTLSVEFSPPEQETVGTSTHGKNPETKKGSPGNHFLTERQRREFLNEKYQVLRSLIPNPTKADRASIVQDAIDYVNELKECANKLQYERGLSDSKRRKVVDGALDRAIDVGDAGSCKGGQHFSNTSKSGQEANASLLSHKTSRHGTEVDVRVFDDEATIKVMQHQCPRSLLLDAILMLNEAELELLHANGARIGNCHAYMLNVKIHDSRPTHASQIARQLLERIDASLEQTPSSRGS